MKSIRITFSIFLAAGFLLSSCSKSNQQAFSKRKYMPWFAKQNLKHKFNSPEKEIAAYELPTAKEEVEKTENGSEVKMPAVAKASVEVKEQTLKAEKKTSEPLTVETPKLNKKQQKRAHRLANKLENRTEPMELGGVQLPSKAGLEQQQGKGWLASLTDGGGIKLLLLVIIAILLPPLAVFIVDGLSLNFLLSIILTIFFWLPGIIHALIVVFRRA